MSTDETQEAVRDAIAGAEIGEARPAMTTKRPWTAGPYTYDRAGQMVWAGQVRIADMRGWSQLLGQNLTDDEAAVIMDANGTLFAAASLLYEVLDSTYTALTAFSDGSNEAIGCLEMIRAALRAANPDAFDAESEGE